MRYEQGGVGDFFGRCQPLDVRSIANGERPEAQAPGFHLRLL
jgi:hypothetical protein